MHVVRVAEVAGTLQQRQLGLAQPQYDDVAIGPAVVRAQSVPSAAMKIDVVLPARVVAKHAEAGRGGERNGVAVERARHSVRRHVAADHGCEGGVVRRSGVLVSRNGGGIAMQAAKDSFYMALCARLQR